MKMPTIIPWQPGQPTRNDSAPSTDVGDQLKAVPPAAPAALAVDTASLETLLTEGATATPVKKAHDPNANPKQPETSPQQPDKRSLIQLSAPPPALAGPITSPGATAGSVPTATGVDRPAIQASAVPGPQSEMEELSGPTARDRTKSWRTAMPSREHASAAFSQMRDRMTALARARSTPTSTPSPVDDISSTRSAAADATSAAATATMDPPTARRLPKMPTFSAPQLSLPKPGALRLPAVPPIVWSAVRVVKRVLWRPRVGRVNLGWMTWCTALLAAAMVHIASTFSVPQIANGESAIARAFFPLALFGSTSAYATLKRQLPANQMVILPPVQAGKELLPFFAPDMRYAMCRFDIAAGPLQVSAILPERGWSLAIHTAQGDNPYVVPAPTNRPLEVSFLLVPTTDRLFNLTPGQRRLNTDATQVSITQREGVIVIRAPVSGVAFDDAALAALRQATCTTVDR